VGKVYTSAELKSIQIAMPTVLGELRFGHITRIFFGMDGVGVSCFELCPAVVPCATADEESGGN
jgi:hypothetical protein